MNTDYFTEFITTCVSFEGQSDEDFDLGINLNSVESSREFDLGVDLA